MYKKIVITCFILVVFLGAISYSSKIANPLIGLKGLVQISIGDEKVEKISDKPLRYISKSVEDFVNFMKSQGYDVAVLGSGVSAQKDGEDRLFMIEGFMGRYEIFSE